ncbi:MAG: hypothetical protein ABI621_04430 [Chloroflexota bacterium]
MNNSDVIVSTVIGFPHGSNLTNIKVAEAQIAMDQGALELDRVLNGHYEMQLCEAIEQSARQQTRVKVK